VTLGIDFTGQDFFRDPAAAFDKLRAAGPVVEVKLPMIGQVWTTTTQEMASRVLKDNHVFTLRKDDGAVAGLRWWMPSIFRVFAKNMRPSTSRITAGCAGSSRKPFVAELSSIWRPVSVRSPASLPMSFLYKEARPISSRGMRERCRFR
jgi:hypothetical protein